MSRTLATGPVPLPRRDLPRRDLPRRDLPPWAAGILTIGSTAAAMLAGLLFAVALAAVAAVVAVRTLIDLV